MQSKQPLCPNCKNELLLETTVDSTLLRKIKKDGTPSYRIKHIKGDNYGSSQLICKYCYFTYDTEHAVFQEEQSQLDEWIEEHYDEINDWSGNK